MGRAGARASLALALLVALGGRVHGSGAACGPCKSLLHALQTKALDGGWAREQLLGACSEQTEEQVRRARGAPCRTLLYSGRGRQTCTQRLTRALRLPAQRGDCIAAATAAEEQIRAAFTANPPAALCAKVRGMLCFKGGTFAGRRGISRAPPCRLACALRPSCPT